jgi:alpha-1,3-mannosyltransferase
MKIIHVVRQFHPCIGGVENVVLNLALRQSRSGHKVSVITLNRNFSDGSQLPLTEDYEGISIKRIPYFGIKRYPLAFSVIKYVADADILDVHCVDFFIDFLVATKAIHRKKIVLHTHGGFFHTPWMLFFKKIYFNLITRLILKGCDRIIAVSHNDQELFLKIARRVEVIENGVDFAKFDAVMKSPVPGRLLYLGRVDRHKKADNLIRVLAELWRRGQNVRLRVVGADWGGHAAELKALAEKLEVAGRIDWIGQVTDDEMLRELASAFLFVSASSYEGFGISAVEAMASGTVCVLNKIEAFKKILGSQAVNLLVDFNNCEETVGKIEKILALSNIEYQAMGDMLKKRAKMFSWDAAIEKLEEIYRSI